MYHDTILWRQCPLARFASNEFCIAHLQRAKFPQSFAKKMWEPAGTAPKMPEGVDKSTFFLADDLRETYYWLADEYKDILNKYAEAWEAARLSREKDRDILTNQLQDLNAQLAAKQKELDASL